MYNEQLPRVLCILVLTVFLQINTMHGQFLKSILKKSQDKLEQKLVDKIADKVAEEITARAWRSIDKSFDDAWQSSFPKDTMTGEVDWDQVNESYSGMIASLTSTVDLPDKYDFKYVLEMETKDYSGKSSKSSLMLNEDSSYIGMQSREEENVLIVFDMTLDAMIMYNESDKNYTTIANYSKLASGIWSDTTMSKQIFVQNLEATGKTKKVVKYETKEYKGDTETEFIKLYIAEDFPISYNDSFGVFIKQFQPTMYQESMDKLKTGMVLKGENKSKTSNKKSSYEVKKINMDGFMINNREYEANNIDIAGQ